MQYSPLSTAQVKIFITVAAASTTGLKSAMMLILRIITENVRQIYLAELLGSVSSKVDRLIPTPMHLVNIGMLQDRLTYLFGGHM